MKKSRTLLKSWPSAYRFLLSLDKHKKDGKFSNQNILAFLEHFNNPQDTFRTVHIAGTSGKGSTCTMIAGILKKAGYKTGLTLSPYIVDPCELIQINQIKISRDIFKNLVNEYRRYIIQFRLSYYEAVIGLAMIYFARRKVDFAVVETGLGGRLDATNVFSDPALSIITSIGLDHTDVLGKTKKSIAKEKAAIIKNKSAITGSRLIKNAKFVDVKKYQMKNNSRDRSRPVSTMQKFKYKNQTYKLKLLGEFQIENAILAIEAARFLKINNKYIKRGLKQTEFFGRFSIIKKKPLIIADGAHNPDKMRAFVHSLKKIIDLKQYKNKYLLVAIKYNKDYKSVLKTILPFFNYIIITNFSEGLKPEIIKKEITKYHKKSIIIRDSKKAYKFFLKKISNNDLGVITGSLYLLGDIFS